jgi:hypothetical protein
MIKRSQNLSYAKKLLADRLAHAHAQQSLHQDHPDGARIYRIVGDQQQASGESRFVNSPFEDVAAFETQIPGFEATAGFIAVAGAPLAFIPRWRPD